MLKCHYTNPESCHEATGMVIVIDVLRAFSTAAYAFSRGTKEILLVSTVEEALSLKLQIPNSRAMGEVGGLPPDGFDFGNSPTEIREQDFNGLTLIQRTGAGTQGAVRSRNADILIAASFVVANSTVNYICSLEPTEVTFVITGIHNNDEDIACAEYLEALMKGHKPPPQPFVQRVYDSRDALQHLDPEQPAFPRSDLDYCTRIDYFDFVMPITREDGKLIMRAIKP
jgi:2-phosphosulfolactate phosphatase